MAIELANYDAPQAVRVPAAYARIDTLAGSAGSISVQVVWYASALARQGQAVPLRLAQFSFVPDAAAPVSLWTQAYMHLRTLPEFQGGRDV